MLHKMNLQPKPFESIKSGLKDIEMRLNDEKRQAIAVGDTIEFTNTDSGELLLVTVINKHVFADFANLYSHFDKARLGYESDEPCDPFDMERYYSAEKIRHYGVLAIEILPTDGQKEKNKKKKSDSELKDNLAEGILEIILTLLLFGLGAGILALFGAVDAIESLDPDLVTLLGIAVLAAIGAVTYLIVKAFKKKKQE